MGVGIETVLVVAVVAAVVVAQGHANNVRMKDGIAIRKCDFPFSESSSSSRTPTDTLECSSRRVFCVDDVNTPSRPWYVLQSRSSRSRTSFNRNYEAYEAGFGRSLANDFWLGLRCLHNMTAGRDNELLVRMVDRAGDVGTAVYSSFAVGHPDTNYLLKVEEFDESRSDVGDSMLQSNGMPFTAFDQDNDINDYRNCAMKYKGGWWYRDCDRDAVNNFLNGYFNRRWPMFWYRGVQWDTWATPSPVVSTLILFRPQLNSVSCKKTTTAAPIYRCPSGSTLFENSSCFLVADSSFNGTHDDAIEFCTGNGMSVASIRSPEEQTFVKGLLDDGVWISLTDLAEESVFVWGDGSPLEYSSFGRGQPDNSQNQEHCVEMAADWDYNWNDAPCSTQRQFLCQTEPVAE